MTTYHHTLTLNDTEYIELEQILSTYSGLGNERDNFIAAQILGKLRNDCRHTLTSTSYFTSKDIK